MDLRKAIREYGGYKPARAFVYVAMSVFDADDGGEITFKEFVKLMTQKPCTSDTEEDIERIFQNFDEDNKGFISEEDLKAAAEELNEEVTDAEIREMIAQCDPNSEGVIRLEHFIAFNKRKNFDWSINQLSLHIDDNEGIWRDQLFSKVLSLSLFSVFRLVSC